MPLWGSTDSLGYPSMKQLRALIAVQVSIPSVQSVQTWKSATMQRFSGVCPLLSECHVVEEVGTPLACRVLDTQNWLITAYCTHTSHTGMYPGICTARSSEGAWFQERAVGGTWNLSISKPVLTQMYLFPLKAELEESGFLGRCSGLNVR